MSLVFELALGELSIREIGALFDAYDVARVSFELSRLQARAKGGALGLMLETEIERCVQAMREIAGAIRSRTPGTEIEVEVRAEALARWGLATGDWGEIARASSSVLQRHTPISSDHSNTL